MIYKINLIHQKLNDLMGTKIKNQINNFNDDDKTHLLPFARLKFPGLKHKFTVTFLPGSELENVCKSW